MSRSRIILDVPPDMLKRWKRAAKRHGWPLALWIREMSEQGRLRDCTGQVSIEVKK